MRNREFAPGAAKTGRTRLTNQIGRALAAFLVVASTLVISPSAMAVGLVYDIQRNGAVYDAISQTTPTTYTGTLKFVVESALADLSLDGGIALPEHYIFDIAVPFCTVPLNVDKFPGVHRAGVWIKAFYIWLFHPARTRNRERYYWLVLEHKILGSSQFLDFDGQIEQRGTHIPAAEGMP